MARVSKGVYSQPDLDSDEYADVHAEILQNYHGVSGKHRNRAPGLRAGDSDNKLDVEGDCVSTVGPKGYDDEEEDLPEELWETVGDEAAAFLGLPKEDAATLTAAAVKIAANQEHNVCHDTVAVPRHNCPFNEEQEVEFWEAVTLMKEEGFIPEGLLMTDLEWAERADNGEEETEYPTSEDIPVGRLHQLQRIPLSLPIWGARALKWCQALSVLNQCLLED